MIEHALKLAINDRRAVYIIAANQREQERIRALVGTPGHGIKVEAADSMDSFDWQDLHIPGAHPIAWCSSITSPSRRTTGG